MSKLILASASPRRKELLLLAGLKFDVLAPDVDESPIAKEKPQKMVSRLSETKAHAIAEQIKIGNEDLFILSADTTVVSEDGKNLGKPRSRTEALKMLKKLQGRSHFVFTGYSIFKIRKGKLVKKLTRTIKTVVTFKKLTSKELSFYLDQGESMDKAGAYAAQGAGMMLVSKMNGSYTNVVGLPLSHVLDDLKFLGFNLNG